MYVHTRARAQSPANSHYNDTQRRQLRAKFMICCVCLQTSRKTSNARRHELNARLKWAVNSAFRWKLAFIFMDFTFLINFMQRKYCRRIFSACHFCFRKSQKWSYHHTAPSQKVLSRTTSRHHFSKINIIKQNLRAKWVSWRTLKTSQPSPQLHALDCKIRCVGNSRANFTLGSKHRRVAEFMTRFRNICTLAAPQPPGRTCTLCEWMCESYSAHKHKARARPPVCALFTAGRCK